MKGFYALLVVFAFVVFNTNAWEGRLISDPDTDQLGDCYLEHVKLIGSMKFNETKRIQGQCALVECESDRSVKIIGCPSVDVPRNCKKLPGIISKPHPDCCYEIECTTTKQ